MIINDIIRLMENEGYHRVQVNIPEICLYHKRIEERSFYVFVTDTAMKGSQNPLAVKGIILQLGYKLRQRDPECEYLSIIVTKQVAEYKELASMQNSVWFVDKEQLRLIVYENQKENFIPLKNKIEALFEQYYQVEASHEMGEGYNTNEPKAKEKWMKENTNGNQLRRNIKKLPVCCTLIVLLNVVVFLVMDFVLNDYQYETLIENYGILWTAVKNHGQYYRLLTYMFLHSGVEHLFNNMLVLFFVGQTLERVLSKPKFLVIYFGSGIIAGVVSMGYNMMYGRMVLSVGASGAIFGLVGAMLYTVLINRGRLRQISARQIVLFVAFSLYGGIASNNVDNAAHIGGFLAGVILAMILVRRENHKERENK